MTSPTGRTYATALTLFTFFLTWALVAARPWPSTAASTPDPRLQALAVREQKLRRESIATQRIVKRRWAAYQAQLAERNSQLAAADAAAAAAPPTPSVQIVSQPAATATSSS
jgi:hypothetical protein